MTNRRLKSKQSAVAKLVTKMTHSRMWSKYRLILFLIGFALAGAGALYVARGDSITIACPLPGRPAISSKHGVYRNGRQHAGIDMPVPIGTPVYAAESGNILKTVEPEQSRGYGKQLDLKSPNFTYRYAHLDRFVRTSGPVQAGELIGYSGNTGGVPPHLHWEMRTDGGGYGFNGSINPAPYYNNCGSGAAQTPVSAPPSTIQGFAIDDATKSPIGGAEKIYIEGAGPVANRTSTRDNPYFFKVNKGHHRIQADKHLPGDYVLVGYTVCYGSTGCHNNPPQPADGNGSMVVDLSGGGFADLWWHYRKNLPATIQGFSIDNATRRPYDGTEKIYIEGAGASVPNGTLLRDNPYFFNVNKGHHRIRASKFPPGGLRLLGYTVCYGRTDCHNNTLKPVDGNGDAVIDLSGGGFADLWWHYGR